MKNNLNKNVIVFLFALMFCGVISAEELNGKSDIWNFFSNAKSNAKRIALSINQTTILAWDSTYLIWSAPYQKDKKAFLIGKENDQIHKYASTVIPWKIDTTMTIINISIHLNDTAFVNSEIVPCYITYSNNRGSQIPVLVYISKPGASAYIPVVAQIPVSEGSDAQQSRSIQERQDSAGQVENTANE